MDVNFIDELLAFTRNIYQTYSEAPVFLKRYYLRLFFDKIYFKDGKIVKIDENTIFSALKEAQYLLISNDWLPLKDLFCNHKLEFDFSLDELKIFISQLNQQVQYQFLRV